MAEFISAVILIVMLVGLGTFLIIFTKKEKEKQKKMDNVYSAITISNITSITAIAQTQGLGINETKKIIEEIINKPTHSNKGYKLLRNAYIDHLKDEVILHPKANHNNLKKTIDYVVEGLSIKKVKKKDWVCSHCNSLNKTKFTSCPSCGARREAR